MDAAATVKAYYQAVRHQDPLHPFFASEGGVVKFGISEALVGHESVTAGLREQTRTTTDWELESRRLRTVERGCHACFTDDVRLAWTDIESDHRHDFETRWSGTLERDGSWQFLGMHVSTAEAL